MQMKKQTSQDESWFEVINLLSELVVFNQGNFNGFLKRLIKTIIQIVPSDSCLIYFYDRESKQLILVGSKKPHTEQIGKIILSKGEGITGWVAENKKTVAIENRAYKDSRFKFFKELPEDRFESFLSVPIVSGDGVVGVINLQNRLPYKFSTLQIKTLESVVKIITSAFTNVVLIRRVNHLEDKLEERKLVEKAKGILMKQKGLNEDQAYRFIQKEAMTKRKSMKDIASAIILVY